MKIQKILEQHENKSLEFKKEIPKNRLNLLKTVVGFANGSGGHIISHCLWRWQLTQGVEKMKWTEIRQKHPNKFILIGDVVEEKISETKYRILEGNILRVSKDGKEIRKAYQQHKKKGMNILFSLPTTPMDFIIEDVPVKGILR